MVVGVWALWPHKNPLPEETATLQSVADTSSLTDNLADDVADDALQLTGLQPSGETGDAARTEEAAESAAAAPSAESVQQESRTPRAVLDETLHDFGTMDPFQTGHYEFKIRNEGSAPLTLERGPTTCKCTLSNVTDGSIPPGGEGEVVLAWQAVRNNKRFAHEASIFTNDPEHEILYFRVEGDIRVRFGADPPEITLSSVRPDQPTEGATLLSSQVWPSFEIRSIECSLPGVTWELAPAGPEHLKKIGSLSGWWLKFTLPAGLPLGYFEKQFSIQVQGPDATANQTYEMPLQGRVLRRLAVYGDGIDSHGTIHVGTIGAGRKHVRRFVVKVRDPLPELPNLAIQTVPDFVQARLVPYPGAAEVGLYRFDVEIPADAPVCVRSHDNRGEIALDFDHPRIEDLRLGLEFVITPPHEPWKRAAQRTEQSRRTDSQLDSAT